MSQHSSLKMDSVGARHRNVLKRHERVTQLRSSEHWGGRDSAFKLPKIKLIKIKVKKEKSSGKEESAAPGAETKPAASASEAKPAAPAAKSPAQEKTKPTK